MVSVVVIVSVVIAGAVYAAWDAWRRTLESRHALRQYDVQLDARMKVCESRVADAEKRAADAEAKAQKAINTIENRFANARVIPNLRGR